jgi:hypothetical protein
MLSVMNDHWTVTLFESVTDSVSSTLQEAETWSRMTSEVLSTQTASSCMTGQLPSPTRKRR